MLFLVVNDGFKLLEKDELSFFPSCPLLVLAVQKDDFCFCGTLENEEVLLECFWETRLEK